MTLSVVLPTYNRLDSLRAALDALENQTLSHQDYEVVVVSDGSNDGTDEYLAAWRTELQLCLGRVENSGAAAARNLGVQLARSELLVFIDDDVVVGPNCLQEHLEVHRQSNRLAVIGPMLSPPDRRLQPWVRWEQGILERQYGKLASGRWQASPRLFFTGNASVKRSDFERAGGFDPRFRRSEDVELAYRLADCGVKFRFNQRASAYHYARRSFSSWIQTAYEYGRHQVIIAHDKGQCWLLPALLTEFEQRHLLVRALTAVCLGRDVPTRLSIGVLLTLARGLELIPTGPGTRYCYSGMFNLRFFQGIADELGGRDAFFANLRTASDDL